MTRAGDHQYHQQQQHRPHWIQRDGGVEEDGVDFDQIYQRME